MEKDNLKLWRSVEKTDPNHTKKAKIGGMSITSVAPQYQILNATREYGAYGVDWGFKKIELDYNLLDKFNLVVFKGTFFCPNGEFQIINSIKMYMNNACTMIDTDFAKKVETDALTKALSKQGFNADIFMGRYDDVKYYNEVVEEFKPKPVKEKLSDTRFKTAIKALAEKKIKKEDILKYALTEDQKNLLKKA